MANSTTTRRRAAPTPPRFELSASTRVLTDDGRDVVPGSGERRAGGACAGTRRSATTRIPRSRRRRSSVVDGVRYSIPGDWAEVLADGTRQAARARQPVHQHRRREGVPGGGRGGAQAAPGRRTTPPSSGSPTSASARRSRRWSSPMPAPSSTTAELIAYVKTKLAAYKAPKDVFVVDDVGRAANGKLDYKAATRRAEDLASSPCDG